MRIRFPEVCQSSGWAARRAAILAAVQAIPFDFWTRPIEPALQHRQQTPRPAHAIPGRVFRFKQRHNTSYRLVRGHRAST